MKTRHEVSVARGFYDEMHKLGMIQGLLPLLSSAVRVLGPTFAQKAVENIADRLTRPNAPQNQYNAAPPPGPSAPPGFNPGV